MVAKCNSLLAITLCTQSQLVNITTKILDSYWSRWHTASLYRYRAVCDPPSRSTSTVGCYFRVSYFISSYARSLGKSFNSYAPTFVYSSSALPLSSFACLINSSALSKSSCFLVSSGGSMSLISKSPNTY